MMPSLGQLDLIVIESVASQAASWPLECSGQTTDFSFSPSHIGMPTCSAALMSESEYSVSGLGEMSALSRRDPVARVSCRTFNEAK